MDLIKELVGDQMVLASRPIDEYFRIYGTGFVNDNIIFSSRISRSE